MDVDTVKTVMVSCWMSEEWAKRRVETWGRMGNISMMEDGSGMYALRHRKYSNKFWDT